jgi:ABC-type Zn uptake system ZnuABC Zn-binding protein ZnuA
MSTRRAFPGLFAAAVLAGSVIAACAGSDAPSSAADAAGSTAQTGGSNDRALLVVTTVSPLRNIVENVGGDRVTVVGLVPEGTNSHTYEPPPSAVKEIAQADVIVINGLKLELPILELAQASARPETPLVLLGDSAIDPDEYVFDFSFPADEGNPNPHLWTSPDLAIRYAEIVAAALSAADPDGAAYFEANLSAFAAQLRAMDERFFDAVATIPPAQRKLLTYHDSFPFFAARYGFEIIGAVQPSGFNDPSPRDLGAIIRQIREAHVPAIFGSEVFRSEVLRVIADEAGAIQVSTLRDDDLPGEQGDPNNTLVAMMVENVRTMVSALGGDPVALAGFDTHDTWRPFAEFEG